MKDFEGKLCRAEGVDCDSGISSGDGSQGKMKDCEGKLIQEGMHCAFINEWGGLSKGIIVGLDEDDKDPIEHLVDVEFGTDDDGEPVFALIHAYDVAVFSELVHPVDHGFIQLTNPQGNPVMVNPDEIATIGHGENGGFITMAGTGKSWTCQETLGEIVRLIANVRTKP